MLKGKPEPVDLAEVRDRLAEECVDEISSLKNKFGDEAIQFLADREQVEIQYPVNEFPEKVKSYNFDKQSIIEGTLMGIKGQYLILDTGVLNIRKFAGYNIALES